MIELVLDLDGVSYEFMSAWNILAVRHGMIQADEAIVTPEEYNFYRQIPSIEGGAHFAQTLEYLTDYGLYEILPPDPAMVLAWQRLAAKDKFHIHVITARPASATDATERWLDNHDMPYARLSVVQDAKSNHLVGPAKGMDTVAVDDSVENIQDYQRHNETRTRNTYIHPILYNQPWNQGQVQATRVYDPDSMFLTVRDGRWRSQQQAAR